MMMGRVRNGLSIQFSDQIGTRYLLSAYPAAGRSATHAAAVPAGRAGGAQALQSGPCLPALPLSGGPLIDVYSQI
jgi:hypothetical protein